MTKPNYNKKKFQDLKETIELKNAEIDELNRHSHHMCECLFSNLQTIISSF